MQYRILTLTFAACLASSLAIADNPSDAPLILDDGNTAAVQKKAQRDGKKKANADKHHHYTHKKEEQRSLRAKDNDASKSPEPLTSLPAVPRPDTRLYPRAAPRSCAFTKYRQTDDN
jgi:hypothetical protein